MVKHFFGRELALTTVETVGTDDCGGTSGLELEMADGVGSIGTLSSSSGSG